jgi:hypothetical protein
MKLEPQIVLSTAIEEDAGVAAGPGVVNEE